MLQSLLALGERVGQEKAYTVVVVVREIARLDKCAETHTRLFVGPPLSQALVGGSELHRTSELH
jgi:hypothetical protein